MIFYVIMVERNDGKIYTDLHKVKDMKFYLTYDAAYGAFLEIAQGERINWHIVEMIAEITN